MLHQKTGLLNAITLVGNKSDLPETAGSVNANDEEFLKIGLNSNFIASSLCFSRFGNSHKFDETSAKDGTGVKEAFEKLIDTITTDFYKNRQMYKRSEEVAVLDGSTVKKKSNTCTTCG